MPTRNVECLACLSTPSPVRHHPPPTISIFPRRRSEWDQSEIMGPMQLWFRPDGSAMCRLGHSNGRCRPPVQLPPGSRAGPSYPGRTRCGRDDVPVRETFLRRHLEVRKDLWSLRSDVAWGVDTSYRRLGPV